MDNGSPTMGFIKKYELAIFAILALLFSWVFWIPLEFYGLDYGNIGYGLNNVGVLGPLVAAVELLLLTQGFGGVKCLVNGLVKWRAGIEWYIVALCLPLAIEVTVLFTMVLSGVNLSINESLIGDSFTLLGQVYFAIVTVVAIFGYLLPRLLKSYSPLVSSLIVTVFFIVWHAPFVMVSINGGKADYELWWAIGNMGVFFVFTWLFRNSKGSLLPLILLNLSLNYFRWFARGVMLSSPMNDLWGLDFSLHLIVGLIILLANRKYFMGKAPDSVEAPEAIPSS